MPIISYKIITPDGDTFEFPASQFTLDEGIPAGFGFPPIEHVSQVLYRQPGARLDAIKVGTRVVTLQLKNAQGDESGRYALHVARAALFDALRWNRTLTDPPPPSTLRYECDGVKTDLNVYYLGDVISHVAGSNEANSIGIRLAAYDPLWYETSSTAAALGVQRLLTVSYLVGKVDGLWDALGAPAMTASPTGTSVYAFALSQDGNTLYVGGAFLNLNGIANADYIAAYDLTTGTWSAIGTGTDGEVRTLIVAPDGTLYAGGLFANAGGVACQGIAKWNGTAWSAVGTGLAVGGGALCMVMDSSGNIYVGGQFANAGGVANTAGIAKWNGSAWSALGTGATGADRIYALALDPSGKLYAGGDFALMGGVANTVKIAKWNGSAWSALSTGMDSTVYGLAIAPDGHVYAGGAFTTAGGIACAKVARWNGAAWAALGLGMNDTCYALGFDSEGVMYALGAFTTAGGMTLSDRMATWDGSTWSPLDIDLPGVAAAFTFFRNGDNFYIGFNTSGSATTSGVSTNITLNGDSEVFPIVTITGPCIWQWLENTTSTKKIVLNVTLIAGEVATLDLSPTAKTLESNARGDLLPYATLLPGSDLDTFALVTDPIAPLGVNTVAVMMTGTTPSELNDGSNQLSGWASITGISYLNTGSLGQLWVDLVADGGGFYHVDLYKTSAKAAGDKVGHTATYNSNGAKAIIADNSSGLGGTVTVDARVGADSDILVYFATAKVTYTNAFLSVDKAIVH